MTEAVRAVEFGIETDFRDVTFHDEIHAFVGKAFRRDFSGLGNAAEEGTFVDGGRREPMFQRRDAAHGRVGEIGDSDLLAFTRLVRFRLANRDDDALAQKL